MTVLPMPGRAHRFEPPGQSPDRPAVVYWLEPPTRATFSLFQADVQAELRAMAANRGLVLTRAPDEASMLDLMEDGVRARFAAGESQDAALQAIAAQRDGTADAAQRDIVAGLEAALVDHPPLIEARRLAALAAGLTVTVTGRMFLAGWEGPGLPEFRREHGGVPDDLLNQLPAGHLDLIWLEIHRLATPTAAEAKN